MIRPVPTLFAFLLLLAAHPASAQEIFGGLFHHDAGIITDGGLEPGSDVVAGWRGGPLLPMIGGPRPHILVSVNSAGATDFAAAGLSWKFGSRVYVRPGIGIAIHNGDVHWSPAYPQNRRIPFGSPVLFEPEMSVGTRIAPRLSVEATWIHLSHAYLFGRLNPGIDTIGLRLNLALH